MNNLADAKMKRPEHVPPELVYEFDYNTDAEYCRDPHARTLDLVNNAPEIYWTPFNGGHWMFQSHKLISEALNNWEQFSSEHFTMGDFEEMMAALPEDERIPAPVPIAIDPPLHTKLRRPLFQTFSPKSIKALEINVRALAERLIDDIAPRGFSEFQHDVADVYPVEIFLEMFGLPVEKKREFRELAKQHLQTITPDLAENMMMLKAVADVVRDTIVERKANPKDDIISMLWSLETDDGPMTLDLILSYCTILFIAGLDTVVNALGFGVRHLAKHPELQSQLRNDPSLIPAAVEEILRRYAFVAPMRIMKEDTEFHGVQLKQGERVMMFIPSASIDEDHYLRATEVDLTREDGAHLAFGAGVHHCLGSHLARAELRIMYETMMAKLPEFRLDPEKPETFHGSIIAGPSTINLLWQGDPDYVHEVDSAIEDSAVNDAVSVSPNTLSSGVDDEAAIPQMSAAPVDDKTGLSGTWNVTIYGPTGPQETVLELRYENSVLSGVQSAMGQVMEILDTEFNVSSGDILWVNKIKSPLPIKLTFKGVFEGASISGKVKAGLMGSFPFTAVRA